MEKVVEDMKKVILRFFWFRDLEFFDVEFDVSIYNFKFFIMF